MLLRRPPACRRICHSGEAPHVLRSPRCRIAPHARRHRPCAALSPPELHSYWHFSNTFAQDATAAVVAAAGALLVIKSCDYFAQEGLLERARRRAARLAASCHPSDAVSTRVKADDVASHLDRRSRASWSTSSAVRALCSRGCFSGPTLAPLFLQRLIRFRVATRPKPASSPPSCRWPTACAWPPSARACCATRLR